MLLCNTQNITEMKIPNRNQFWGAEHENYIKNWVLALVSKWRNGSHKKLPLSGRIEWFYCDCTGSVPLEERMCRPAVDLLCCASCAAIAVQGVLPIVWLVYCSKLVTNLRRVLDAVRCYKCVILWLTMCPYPYVAHNLSVSLCSSQCACVLLYLTVCLCPVAHDVPVLLFSSQCVCVLL